MTHLRTNQFYLEHFSPSKITLARELRGYSKKSLAEKIQKTPSTITQIENGKLKPDIDTFSSIVIALAVRPSFFSSEVLAPSTELSECNFRSKRAATQTIKKQSVAYGRIVFRIFDFLESLGVKFPSPSIPKSSSSSLAHLEFVAATIRNHWELGISPLPDLMNVLEEHGIFVILLDAHNSDLDAYSLYIDGRPCIMLDYEKPASRQQFDLAHELGHLVLHDDSDLSLAIKEREANWFAGAFLAPAELFKQDCPRRWHYGAYLELKKRWHMSMQACMYRAKQLNLMSDSSYQWGMKRISIKKERFNEKGEFNKSKPLLLTQALELVKEEITLNQLSDETGINTSELKAMLSVQQVPTDIIEFLSPKEKNRATIVSLDR